MLSLDLAQPLICSAITVAAIVVPAVVLAIVVPTVVLVIVMPTIMPCHMFWWSLSPSSCIVEYPCPALNGPKDNPNHVIPN